MAYLEKYFISYCDDFGTQRRVSILERDYEEAGSLVSDNISASEWVNTQLEITNDRIVATNSNSPHWITNTVNNDNGISEYKLTFEVKSAEYSRVYIRLLVGSDYVIIYYDIASDVFYSEDISGMSFNNKTSTNLGDGWYRLDMVFSSVSGSEMDVVLGIVNFSNQYIFSGNNLNGVNTDGLELRSVSLTDNNANNELLADVNPIAITYDSSEDFKFSPIRPSVAEVNMIFGSGDGIDFEEFWRADEKQFKIEDIKDGKVEWSGFVIPDGFSYELKGGLYHATLSASDGLGTLESLTFVDDNFKPYGNQDLVFNNGFEFPFSLIITEILKKLELDLDLWTCVDNYERTMLKTGDVREADPLSAAYVNVKTYIKAGENEKIPYWYGSGEEWNCKEVLENALYIFGAKLYQEFGVWRVKSVNSDVDYGLGNTQRYWRKYNTAGTYLFDYETSNDEINIPCNDITKLMIGNDHVMSMDDVYKSFRINYEYAFIRDGDSPINLLPNSNFCDFDNNSKLASPTGWYRWNRDNRWHIRIKDIQIPFEDAGGHTCGVEIGTQKTGIPTSQTDPNAAIWTSLQNDGLIYVEEDSALTLSMWNKYKYFRDDRQVQYAPMYRMVFYGSNGKKYYLRNNIKDNVFKYTWEDTGRDFDTSIRRSSGSNNTFTPSKDHSGTYFFSLDAFRSKEKRDGLGDYVWREFSFEIENPPSSGWIEFNIHGLAASAGRRSSSFPPFKSWTISSNRNLSDNSYTFTDKWAVVREGWEDQGGVIPRLQITGLSIGIIRKESELPQQHDYIYNNENKNYTLQEDPITIYNGDIQDENHLSNIIVPTNTGGGKNFWDDLSNSYGTSSLGLLVVRQIMRQYAKPYRILEGTIKIQDARFGSVYTFGVLPDVRFILQRGTMNKQKQYIEDATFIQLTDDVLPDGGFEGGNSLNPEWVDTGAFYCQKNNNGLNSGFTINEEVDVNPNSESFQETREVVSDDRDVNTCPLDQPNLYYFGSDTVNLNVFTLNYFPITIISTKEIEISFNNDDGNYLYFVHLKSLGSIDRVSTLTSPNNALSDWVYLNDVIIDGFIYRVLRTDYVMAEFTNFTHNFKFA